MHEKLQEHEATPVDKTFILAVADALSKQDERSAYLALEALSAFLTELPRTGGEDQLWGEIGRFIEDLNEPTAGLVYYLADNYSRLLIDWNFRTLTFTLVDTKSTPEVKNKWLQQFGDKVIKVGI